MIRIVIMLALPVSILLIFLTVTILLSWVSGTGLCGTWMARNLLQVIRPMLANEHRQELVAVLAQEFPGSEAHALAAALAIMFATSMTPDPAQQSDQARILNEIMSRWQPAIPWQLVRRSN